jgi:hypothetical protein
MNEPENEQEAIRIPLDGSFGLGPIAELTVITKHGTAEKEETFSIPYAIIDTKILEAYNRMNLIRGYKLVKVAMETSLKELGL